MPDIACSFRLVARLGSIETGCSFRLGAHHGSTLRRTVLPIYLMYTPKLSFQLFIIILQRIPFSENRQSNLSATVCFYTNTCTGSGADQVWTKLILGNF